jgi:hypothetical protein
MTPSQLKTYFQTVSIQQEYLKKRRENLKDAKQLIPKEDVRDSFVTVFKIISIFFDTLPDVLERDGIIDKHKVDDAIEVVDSIRSDLAIKVEDYVVSLDNE